MKAEGQSPAVVQLRWLMSFHDWARPRITAAAGSLSDEAFRRPGAIPGANEDGSLWAALAHILGAEDIWYRRWRGEAISRIPGAADYPTLGVIAEEWAGLGKRRRDWLARVEPADLDRPLTYRSVAAGVLQSFPLWQTILHVSNHTTHHRGEVAAALSGLGAPPESVDLIDYMRSLAGR